MAINKGLLRKFIIQAAVEISKIDLKVKHG